MGIFAAQLVGSYVRAQRLHGKYFCASVKCYYKLMKSWKNIYKKLFKTNWDRI
jgi:hypothetical protein